MWVIFDLLALNRSEGDTDYKIDTAGWITQMKKNSSSGTWQFYGNRVDWKGEFYTAKMAVNSGAGVSEFYIQFENVNDQEGYFKNEVISLNFPATEMANGSSYLLAGTWMIMAKL